MAVFRALSLYSPIEFSQVCGVSFPIARQSQRAARGGFLPPLNRQGSTQNTIRAATKHPGASSISHILRVSIRIKRLRNGQKLHPMALQPMALHRGELSHIPSSSEATYNVFKVGFIYKYLFISYIYIYALRTQRMCRNHSKYLFAGQLSCRKSIQVMNII